jgi:dTDP-glucose 4,6-dehydratase
VCLACRDYGVERIVHISTSEVYGTARYVPIDEAHPLQAQSPYSASKIGADKIAESFYFTYGLPVAIARPFNTYGPRQSARAVIPTIITQALTRGEVKIGNLSPSRDFTYVEDTVDGLLRIASCNGAIGEVVNIGSGREISIEEIAQMVIGLIGRDVRVVVDQQRIRPRGSEVERLLCDNRKARRILAWEPKVSLEDGLRRTIQWIRGSLGLYQPERYAV